MKPSPRSPTPFTREDLFTAAALMGLLAALPDMKPDTFAALKGGPNPENICRLAQVFGREQAALARRRGVRA